MEFSEDENIFTSSHNGLNSSKHSNDASCSYVKLSIYYHKIFKFINARLCSKCITNLQKNFLLDMTRCAVSPRYLSQKIVKFMAGFQKKLWNKLFYLYHLSIVSEGNRQNYLKKLYLCKKLKILPFQKAISKFNNEDLPTLFYGPISYLFDLIRNKYHFKKCLPFSQKNIKFIFSNECYKFKEIRVYKYSNILLLVYSCFFLKVLSQYRDKNLSFHDIIYKFLNICDNRSVIGTISQMCQTYYFHAPPNEMIHSFFGKKLEKFQSNKVPLHVNSFQCQNLRKQIIKDDLRKEDTMFQNVSETFGHYGIETKDTTNLRTGVNSRDCLKNILNSTLSCGAENKLKTVCKKQNLIPYGKINCSINKPDFGDFTLPQQNLVSGSEVLDTANSKNIIPTKTNDVTKIKGWRKKMFHLKNIGGKNMNCVPNSQATSVNISSENTSILEVKEKPFEVKQTPMIKQSRETNFLDVEEKPLIVDKYITNSSRDTSFLDVEEKPFFKKCYIIDRYRDTSFLDVEEKPLIENIHITNSSRDTGFLDVEEKPLVKDQHIIDRSKDTSSIDKVDNDNSSNEFTKLYLKLLSEDIVYQNLLKKINKQKKQKGVFTSSILDEYLENHSTLTVGFDSLEPSSKHCKSSISKYNLPIILPCLSTNDNHKHCTQVSKIQLGMVINVGIGRPFLEEVAKNVEKLKKNVSIIDRMWANIAASAIHSNIRDKKISRFLVPVVVDSLIDTLKHENFPIKTSKVNEVVVHSDDKNNSDFGMFGNVLPIDVDLIEIEKTVEDMLENIDKREKLALHKPNLNEKDFTRCAYNFTNRKEDIKENKEEIIKYCYSLLSYEKESKLLTLLKEYKQKFSKPEKIVKRDTDRLNRLFSKMYNQHPFTLEDVFIWCCIHSRFHCYCTGKIIFLKHNKLLWKPSPEIPYLSVKKMCEISINNNFPNYHGFSPNIHCSRTAGSLFNYKLRNSNPIFKYKRLVEINNLVLSSTNSCIKVHSRYFVFSCKQATTKLKPICNVKIKNKNEIIIGEISLNLFQKEVSNEKQKVCFKENSNVTSQKMKPIGRPLETKDTQVIKRSYGDKSARFQGMISSKPGLGRINESKLVEYSISNPANINICDTLKENDKSLFKYGLLCLTEGFGFLPVKQYTPDKLLIQDPLRRNIFRFCKDLDAANEWLNRFFKQHLVFESPDINLKWVVVEARMLKNLHPFDKSLIEQHSKFVNKDGILIDKQVTIFEEERKKSTESKHQQLSGQSSSTASKHHQLSGQSSSTPSKHQQLSGQSLSTTSKHQQLSGQSSSTTSKHQLSGQSLLTPSKHHQLSGQSLSTASKHHQLSGQSFTKRAIGEIIENSFSVEGVPSKKVKTACSSREDKYNTFNEINNHAAACQQKSVQSLKANENCSSSLLRNLLVKGPL